MIDNLWTLTDIVELLKLKDVVKIEFYCLILGEKYHFIVHKTVGGSIGIKLKESG